MLNIQINSRTKLFWQQSRRNLPKHKAKACLLTFVWKLYSCAQSVYNDRTLSDSGSKYTHLKGAKTFLHCN